VAAEGLLQASAECRLLAQPRGLKVAGRWPITGMADDRS